VTVKDQSLRSTEGVPWALFFSSQIVLALFSSLVYVRRIKAAKLQLFPKSHQEWLRFAFCTLETLVAGMSIKLLVAEMDLPPNSYVEVPYHLVLFLAVVALAVISWFIRRQYPSLAGLGWITALFGFIVDGYIPAIT